MIVIEALYEAKYVSRDIHSYNCGMVEFKIREPQWFSGRGWWADDEVGNDPIFKQLATEFLKENGWCPEPGEAYAIEWID